MTHNDTFPELVAAIRGGERPIIGLYRRDCDNTCPSCAGSNWDIGRCTAECAICGHAVPLAAPLPTDTHTPLTERKSDAQ